MAADQSKASTLAEELAKLRSDYLNRLPTELSTLQALAASLGGGEADRTKLDELHHRLHKLAGIPSVFNLATLSACARTLEQRSKDWLAGSLNDVSTQARYTFIADVAALNETVTEVEMPATTTLPVIEGPMPGQTLNVWLVEDDALLGQELARQLESFNYAVRLFTRLDDAEQAAQAGQPDMLLMDVMFEQEKANATQALNTHPHLMKLSCPLLFICSADDFESRIRAVRLGAVGYFLKPLDIPRLVARMMQIIETRQAPLQRVLIVDDDVDLARHYCLTLQLAGMEVDVLHQPKAIIEKLATFRPELVLMDMHMPDYSGPELAGLIRQHDNWASLPIVYLSAETDLTLQVQALGRGADDFLTKPITDARLIAAVRVRIERARQLANQIVKDGLTGLLKHANIKEAANTAVVHSRRIGKPVTLAMLDIDHFKLVNDTYGHAMGDVVISSIATLLRQRLRQSDIAGRYGGEEFMVVLPECNLESAQQLINDIRQRFSNVRFSHEGKAFNCTLSAGIACSAQHPGFNTAELLAAADKALYAAKQGGRNQIKTSALTHSRST